MPQGEVFIGGRYGRYERFSVRHTVRACGSDSFPASNGTGYEKRRIKKEKEVMEVIREKC